MGKGEGWVEAEEGSGLMRPDHGFSTTQGDAALTSCSCSCRADWKLLPPAIHCPPQLVVPHLWRFSICDFSVYQQVHGEVLFSFLK